LFLFDEIEIQRKHWKIHKGECRKTTEPTSPPKTDSPSTSIQTEFKEVVLVEKYSVSRGRHLVAARDIERGELICSVCFQSII
jgi:hypothetical protein